MKKKMDLQKILRCIFLALAIVSMLIAIAGKVSAEEMNPKLQEYVYEYFDTYIKNYPRDLVAQAVSECQYFACYKITDNRGWFYYFIDFYNQKNIGLAWSKYNGSNANFGKRFSYWDSNLSTDTYYAIKTPVYKDVSQNIVTYRFSTDSSNYSYLGGYKFTSSMSSSYWIQNNLFSGYFFGGNYGSPNLTQFGDDYYNPFSSFEYISSYGDVYLQINKTTWQSFEDTIVPPSINSKFKIYSTFGSAGISDPILHIEYNDTLFDAGYTYTSFTQYDLTFDVDGETVVYSADSDQFPDDFFTAEYNSGFRVPYEYIYEMLSDQLFNFSEVSSVKLVQVDMTATAYPDLAHLGTPQTKTASTLCSLNLKGYDVIPEYDDASPVEITDKTLVYDQVVDSNDYINHSGEFNSANIPSWADMVTIIVYNDPVGQNFNAPFSCDLYINDDILKSFSFSGYTDPNYFITTSTGTVIDYDHLVLNKAYLSEFIIVSKLLDSADCVHFISGDYNGNGTWTTYDSYLFINQSYYQKLTIKGIGNLQSAVEAGSYYTKGLYTYVYSKLNSMAENSITYYTNSFTALQEQKSILGSINSGLLSVKDTISSGTDRIVTAIGSISSGGSSYNLPSLSSEIQRLFIPSLSWESIDFEEYIDSLGVLGLPFTSTNDILMATRSNYSPDFEIHINDFKPTILGETFTVFEDQDYSFNPRRIFSLEIWSTLQYLNAFALILGEAWFTYCHIFRREKNDC